jgi:hypothetical protein
MGTPTKTTLQAKKTVYLQPKISEITGFYKSSIEQLNQVPVL